MKANYSVMNEKSMSAVSTSVKGAIEKLKGVSSYMGTIEGAMDIITKFWDKNKTTKVSYREVVAELGLNYNKPSEMRKAVLAMVTKMEGLHPGMTTLVTRKVEGVDVTTLEVGVWSSKNLVNENVEPTYDAKGKAIYPYVTMANDKGEDKPVKVDVCKNVSKWTPGLVCKMLIQNEALKTGKLNPFTSEMFWEGVANGTIDMDSVDKDGSAPVVPASAPTAPAKEDVA